MEKDYVPDYMRPERQEFASAALPASEDPQVPVLSPAQVSSWQELGFCLVDGILPKELVDLVQSSCPIPAELAADSGIGLKDNGLLFPCMHPKHACLNTVTLFPRVITACAQLLACQSKDLRLSQSELWIKFNREKQATSETAKIVVDTSDSLFDSSGSQDQRMHIDGHNHYLTYPSEWYNPDAVAMIIYYDDTSICGGGTCVVPRLGVDDPAYHQEGEQPFLLTPGGRSDLPWLNERRNAETYLESHNPDVYAFRHKLYERERQVSAKPGTILFYRLDAWHRGVPLHPGATRRVQNLIFKHHRADWVNSWNEGAAKNMYSKAQTLERLVASSTMHQRYVMGFPQEDSSYWTPYTLAACRARYERLPGGFQHSEGIVEAVRRREQQQQSRTKIFVYGSLLRGLENHHLLQGEKYLHRARTVDSFYMVSNRATQKSEEKEKAGRRYNPTDFEPQEAYKYPFLLKEPAAADHFCSRIAGEVYEVSPEALARLDVLEDHPTTYRRHAVQVQNLERGGYDTANVYLLQSDALLKEISESLARDASSSSYELVREEHGGSWLRYLGRDR